MGRPWVSFNDLCNIGGMSLAEVEACLLQGEFLVGSRFCAVSRTWPMGFAWSSFVAQEFLLDVCHSAGLSESCILSCQTARPLSSDVVFAAATDDVGEMIRRGVLRNPAKDVNDELSAICVGVALENGTHLGIPCARCLAMLVGMIHLLSCAEASPKQVHQQLGVQQWFDLLRRCKLAVHDKVYQFARDPHDSSLAKCCLNLVLVCCLECFGKSIFGNRFCRSCLHRMLAPNSDLGAAWRACRLT